MQNKILLYPYWKNLIKWLSGRKKSDYEMFREIKSFISIKMYWILFLTFTKSIKDKIVKHAIS
jgi:hypothetical protein